MTTSTPRRQPISSCNLRRTRAQDIKESAASANTAAGWRDNAHVAHAHMYQARRQVRSSHSPQMRSAAARAAGRDRPEPSPTSQPSLIVPRSAVGLSLAAMPGQSPHQITRPQPFQEMERFGQAQGRLRSAVLQAACEDEYEISGDWCRGVAPPITEPLFGKVNFCRPLQLFKSNSYTNNLIRFERRAAPRARIR